MLLIVLVHVLRIVYKLKCLCTGLRHSQMSVLSRPLSFLGQFLCKGMFLQPENEMFITSLPRWDNRPSPYNIHNLHYLPTEFLVVGCSTGIPSRPAMYCWVLHPHTDHLQPRTSGALGLGFATFRKSFTIYIKPVLRSFSFSVSPFSPRNCLK